MADRIPDSLIDEILASAKKYVGEEEDVDYSAEKIDSLLAGISDDEQRTVNKEKPKLTLNIAEIVNADEEISVETDGNEDGDVDVQVDDNGQLELTDDGIGIGSDEDIAVEAEETEKSTPELKSVSGQISIEKTRMFNEVQIRGAYNPNISHNLGNKVVRTTSGDAQPVTSPVMGEEKYRKIFMNKPVQKLEKTQEHRDLLSSLPPKTMETPGVVVKKSNKISADTDGFEPLPTIVPAEYELEQGKTRVDIPKVTEKAEHGQEAVSDNQIMFEGFGAVEKAVEQDEEQIENELIEARKNVVKSFVDGKPNFTPQVDNETERKHRKSVQERSIAREYYGDRDKIPVEEVYETEKKGIIVKTVVLSVICFVMAILSAVAGAENGNFEIYGNNEYIYVAIQLILLLVATCINYSSFTNTFRNLKNKTVDIDSVISVSAVAGIIQCAAAFFFTDSVESVACIMASGAIVPMIMKTVGELIRCKGDMDNFRIVSDSEAELYSVHNIDDEDTANEIARGLMLGDPEIKFSTKINFPARFVELSRLTEVTEPLFKVAVPAVCGIALAVGIICSFVSKSIFAGISAFTGIILMGLPVSASLISIANISAANKKLNEENTLINGYNAVEDAVNSNGVVIDACDAFMQGGCNIEGMKLYHKMRIDEAILYTASVIIEAGGVLADVFEGVIIGKNELLFPVESLAYEEKLGCSCWIHNHRVLVGNRELLVHHNVEVPDKELEDKFKNAGKNVIYLAIEGKISAMFVVVYKANEETAKYMREFEKDGITIFFRTSDANITESFLEKEFGLPENVVKIINPVAGEMFTNVKKKQTERTDAKIIHNGSVKTMLSAIHSTFQISSYTTASRTVQLVASFLGVAIVSAFAFLSGLAQIGVWQIIIYQAVWAVVLSVIPAFRKI